MGDNGQLQRQPPPHQPMLRQNAMQLRRRAMAMVGLTAFGFLSLLSQELTPFLTAQTSAFGTDYRSSHQSVGVADLPAVAESRAADHPSAPDLDKLAGTTGIINIGFVGRYIVFKEKFLASLQMPPPRHAFLSTIPTNTPHPVPHTLQGIIPSMHNAIDKARVFNLNHGNIGALLQKSEVRASWAGLGWICMRCSHQ